MSDFTKTKNFCSAKDTAKKMKRQATNQKMFAKHISDKGLVSEIHKEHLNFNSKKTTQF